MAKAGEYTVLVIESAWTLVGIKCESDDKCVSLSNTYVIRKYGDGNGVTGIEAKSGTVFDKFNVDSVQIPESKILFSFEMPEGWSPE